MFYRPRTVLTFMFVENKTCFNCCISHAVFTWMHAFHINTLFTPIKQQVGPFMCSSFLQRKWVFDVCLQRHRELYMAKNYCRSCMRSLGNGLDCRAKNHQKQELWKKMETVKHHHHHHLYKICNKEQQKTKIVLKYMYFGFVTTIFINILVNFLNSKHPESWIHVLPYYDKQYENLRYLTWMYLKVVHPEWTRQTSVNVAHFRR